VAAETLFAAGFHPEHHFRVEAISLMRSTLHPTGAVYERLARAPLKDGAPGGIGGRETAC
jgi:2'-5' RNA ligase